MTSRVLRIAAWIALAAILFVTISPVGLRPHDVVSTNVDRAAAYAVMSALFVLAYPRHWWAVAALVIVTVGGTELSQFLSPTRHPGLIDAVVKAGGGAVGLVAGLLLYCGAAKFRRSDRQ